MVGTVGREWGLDWLLGPECHGEPWLMASLLWSFELHLLEEFPTACFVGKCTGETTLNPSYEFFDLFNL